MCVERKSESVQRESREMESVCREIEREGVCFEIERGSVCRDREECLKIKKRECTWREKEK